MFSPRTASHYLIITLRNIAAIFQPHPPTMMLSQGSSQDRLSQRKKKLGLDSQDSREGESSRGPLSDDTSSSNSASMHMEPVGAVLIDSSPVLEVSAYSGANLSRQSSYNDWDDSIFKHALSQESDKKTIKPEPSSPSKKQKQGHPNPGSTSSPQRSSYTQEINFQSLQPTFGGSSMVPARDVAATPMIPVGILTPHIPSTGAPGVGGGRSLLSSFAAPANLRKRSSSLTSSQRTISTGSASEKGAQPPSQQAIPYSNVSGPSLSPLSPNTTRPGPADTSNLSDWPDDFGEVDFMGALEEDLSSGSVDPRSNQGNAEQLGGSDISGVSKSGLLSNPVAPPSRRDVDDDGEDDLDNLLDGLDEAELYDL